MATGDPGYRILPLRGDGLISFEFEAPPYYGDPEKYGRDIAAAAKRAIKSGAVVRKPEESAMTTFVVGDTVRSVKGWPASALVVEAHPPKSLGCESRYTLRWDSHNSQEQATFEESQLELICASESRRTVKVDEFGQADVTEKHGGSATAEAIADARGPGQTSAALPDYYAEYLGAFCALRAGRRDSRIPARDVSLLAALALAEGDAFRVAVRSRAEFQAAFNEMK